jgi:hypothetical protein
MEPRELVESALRVLKAWMSGDRLPSADVEIVRQHALPGEEDLPLDDVACRIVNRECSRAIAESRQDRKGVEKCLDGPAKRKRHHRKIA